MQYFTFAVMPRGRVVIDPDISLITYEMDQRAHCYVRGVEVAVVHLLNGQYTVERGPNGSFVIRPIEVVEDSEDEDSRRKLRLAWVEGKAGNRKRRGSGNGGGGGQATV